MTSETDYPVDESAMSTSTPVLDRVGARLRRLSMRADAVQLAPHPWRHADRARRGGVRRPRGLVLPAPARAPWASRRRLHLRRGVAAELALQVGDGGHLVLRRGRLALDHVDAAGRRRRVRRDDPLRPRLVRALPDAPGPRRRADPPARLHARAVDPAPPGGGAAVQPGRVLLRRAGRDDEPPHQPVPLRAGHPGLGAVRRRASIRCGRTRPPRTGRSS